MAWLSVALLALVVQPAVGLALLALALVPYGALSLAVSFRAARRHQRASLAWYLPIVFFIMHAAYGAGALVGLARAAVTPRQLQPQPMGVRHVEAAV